MGSYIMERDAQETREGFLRLKIMHEAACNLKCSYCKGEARCVNYVRQGINRTVLDPEEALLYARIMRRDGIRDIGIAVPGDALLYDSTIETLRAFKQESGNMPCISTNGILLADRLDDLLGAGVRKITVTINAVSAEVAQRVYESVTYDGQTLYGMKAAELIVQKQWQGVITAAKSGLRVAINTVFLPGINDHEIQAVAMRAGLLGAVGHNILPQPDFRTAVEPSPRSAQLTSNAILADAHGVAQSISIGI